MQPKAMCPTTLNNLLNKSLMLKKCIFERGRKGELRNQTLNEFASKKGIRNLFNHNKFLTNTTFKKKIPIMHPTLNFIFSQVNFYM